MQPRFLLLAFAVMSFAAARPLDGQSSDLVAAVDDQSSDLVPAVDDQSSNFEATAPALPGVDDIGRKLDEVSKTIKKIVDELKKTLQDELKKALQEILA
ncbi:hypothetical protein BGZ68_004292 [Mortierella alpina]|nr:hypothetical protein BGZ68_004292 [Mortierella alpina]